MKNKKKINTITWFYIIAFLFTVILSFNGKYITIGNKIEVNEVSPQQFVAPRDLENTVATQKLRDAAMDAVSDQLMEDTVVSEEVNNVIREFIAIADAEREAYADYEPETVTNEEGEVTVVGEPVYKSSALRNILNSKEEDNSKADLILTLSEEEYEKFKTVMLEIFDQALNMKITDKESDMTRVLTLTRDQLNNMTSNDDLYNIGYQLFTTFFKPNYVVDVETTESLKQAASDAVVPIIYKEGVIIVDNRRIIDEEMYAALESLGYINNSFIEQKIPILGITILSLMLFIAGVIYFQIDYKSSSPLKQKEENLLFTIYMATIFIIYVTGNVSTFFVPMAIFGSIILVSVFLGLNRGMFYTIFITLISTIMLGNEIENVSHIAVTGVFLTIYSFKILQRKSILKLAFLSGVFSSILYLGNTMIYNNTITSEMFVKTSFVFIYMVAIIIICFGIIPFIEIGFGILTPNKLLELSNPNNPLIKKLIFETPGTYHHSLIVANLAESAAMEIGANYSLARVAAYYHDIGKTKSPNFFSENQVGENPHDNLSPRDSFKIIKSHIDYGVELGEKYKLPREIINMIPEHHGSTLVKYFYYKEKNDSENPENINPDDFRYAGDRPKSKEAAILMLADTCEAAVRSIITKGKSMEAVNLFVGELIKGKIDEGQLVESGLTFGDVENIQIAFMRVFKGMYHERIEYPKLKEKTVNTEEN